MALKPRVLITGATGFTGRHACRRFAASGWEVVAVSSGRRRGEAAAGAGDGGSAESAGSGADGDLRRAPGELKRAGLEAAPAAWTAACDLTDREAARRLLEAARPDAVLHLAGQNAVDRSWAEPDATIAANVMATAHMLEGMRAVRPDGRVLVVGSMLSGLPGEPAHPYAFSKSAQASAALAWHRWYGMAVLVAEPSNLIGPGGSGGLCGKIARWAAALETAEAAAPQGAAAFRLSSLTETRDYLDVRDAASAYERLLRVGEPGRRYALESGRMRTLREVRDAFERAAAITLRWVVGDTAGPSPQPRDCAALLALGWRPGVIFEQSVADMLREERARRTLTGEGRGR